MATTVTWDPDAAPGDYRFLVGLQRAEDGTRLTTADGRDALSIGPVSISPGEAHDAS